MRDLMLLGTAKQLQNYRGGGRGLAHGPPHGRLRPRLPTRPPVRLVAAPFGRGGTWLLHRRKKPVTPGCGRQRLCTRLGRAEDARATAAAHVGISGQRPPPAMPPGPSG